MDSWLSWQSVQRPTRLRWVTCWTPGWVRTHGRPPGPGGGGGGVLTGGALTPPGPGGGGGGVLTGGALTPPHPKEPRGDGETSIFSSAFPSIIPGRLHYIHYSDLKMPWCVSKWKWTPKKVKCLWTWRESGKEICLQTKDIFKCPKCKFRFPDFHLEFPFQSPLSCSSFYFIIPQVLGTSRPLSGLWLFSRF